MIDVHCCKALSVCQNFVIHKLVVSHIAPLDLSSFPNGSVTVEINIGIKNTNLN